MGQQLIGRPLSQRASFPTLGTASSGNAPDLSQYLGFMTPPAATASVSPLMQPPGIIGGFRGFGGMPRWNGGGLLGGPGGSLPIQNMPMIGRAQFNG